MRFLFLFLFLLLAGAAGSQSIKLKITGITDADGEEVMAYEGADSTTFSFGGPGGGITAGVSRFSDVRIKKQRGTSTNELFRRSILGSLLPEVTIEFNDGAKDPFYKIVLKDVGVSLFSYLSPECTGCTKLFHEVRFVFQKIEWTDVATGNTFRYDQAQRKLY